MKKETSRLLKDLYDKWQFPIGYESPDRPAYRVTDYTYSLAVLSLIYLESTLFYKLFKKCKAFRNQAETEMSLYDNDLKFWLRTTTMFIKNHIQLSWGVHKIKPKDRKSNFIGVKFQSVHTFIDFCDYIKRFKNIKDLSTYLIKNINTTGQQDMQQFLIDVGYYQGE